MAAASSATRPATVTCAARARRWSCSSRLPRALADGDRIYAVIRGSAVNNDGRSSGSMGTPSRVGQEELLRRAYRRRRRAAGPRRIHRSPWHRHPRRRSGRARRAGRGPARRPQRRSPRLRRFGQDQRRPHRRCGRRCRSDQARAGAAPPRDSPGVCTATSRIRRFRGPRLPLDIAREATRVGRAGRRHSRRRRERVRHRRHQRARRARGSAAAPAAADGATDVETRADALGEEFRSAAGARRPLSRLCSATSEVPVTTCAGARQLAEPRSIIVPSWSRRTGRRCASHSRSYAGGEALAIEGRAAQTDRPRVAFVCPGQGAQWVGMARELAARSPVFRAALAASATRRRARYVTWSILEQIHAQPGTPEYLLDQIDVIQPVLVSLSIAYAQLLPLAGRRARRCRRPQHG